MRDSAALATPTFPATIRRQVPINNLRSTAIDRLPISYYQSRLSTFPVVTEWKRKLGEVGLSLVGGVKIGLIAVAQSFHRRLAVPTIEFHMPGRLVQKAKGNPRVVLNHKIRRSEDYRADLFELIIMEQVRRGLEQSRGRSVLSDPIQKTRIELKGFVCRVQGNVIQLLRRSAIGADKIDTHAAHDSARVVGRIRRIVRAGQVWKQIDGLDAHDAQIHQGHHRRHYRHRPPKPRGRELLIHVIGDEIVALEDIVKSIAHVLKQLTELSRRDGFKVRKRPRSFETEENIAGMIRKQYVGVEEVRPAKGIQERPVLSVRYLHLVGPPTFGSRNAVSYLAPLRRHPLFVLGERFELCQSFDGRIPDHRRNAGQYLRRGSRAPIELNIVSCPCVRQAQA